MLVAILSIILTVLPVIVAAWVRSYQEEKAADDAMGRVYRDELRSGLERLDRMRDKDKPGSPASPDRVHGSGGQDS
jgi:hypothetical protein